MNYEKSERNRSFRILYTGCHNFTINPLKAEHEDVDNTHCTQNRDKWQRAVDIVINISVVENA